MTVAYDNTNRGALFREENRKSDKHPEFSGTLNVEGREYYVDAWVNQAQSGRKYFSLSVKPKAPAKESPRGPQQRQQPQADLDDDIPF